MSLPLDYRQLVVEFHRRSSVSSGKGSCWSTTGKSPLSVGHGGRNALAHTTEVWVDLGGWPHASILVQQDVFCHRQLDEGCRGTRSKLKLRRT